MLLVHVDGRPVGISKDQGPWESCPDRSTGAPVGHHEDLTAAAHHDELVPRPGCLVHLDAAHRGPGTASCGPDTSLPYLVPSGVHRWSWTLRML